MPEEPRNVKKKRWQALLGRPRIRIGPVARRRLVRLGVVVAAVTAVAFVPGYVASQPRFLGGYADFDGAYQTWTKSVHAQVACRECHVSPQLPQQAVYSVRMLGEFYARVLPSRKADVLSTPTDAACSSCHIDLRTVSASGDLKIPHRAHVQVLKIECVTCHEYLVHEKSPEGKHVPRMTMCLGCHDGHKAKNACATCHTEKATPANHKAKDWQVVHSTQQKKMDCDECHAWKEGWCVDCHRRRPRGHVAKWRSLHRLQIEKHRNCEACHEGDFCHRCHGELPKLNFNPAVKLVK